jgi:hypothetical protein
MDIIQRYFSFSHLVLMLMQWKHSVCYAHVWIDNCSCHIVPALLQCTCSVTWGDLIRYSSTQQVTWGHLSIQGYNNSLFSTLARDHAHIGVPEAKEGSVSTPPLMADWTSTYQPHARRLEMQT